MEAYEPRHSRLDTQSYVGAFARRLLDMHFATSQGFARDHEGEHALRSYLAGVIVLREEVYGQPPYLLPSVQAAQYNAIYTGELAAARNASLYRGKIAPAEISPAGWLTFKRTIEQGLRYASRPPRSGQELLHGLYTGRIWHELPIGHAPQRAIGS